MPFLIFIIWNFYSDQGIKFEGKEETIKPRKPKLVRGIRIHFIKKTPTKQYRKKLADVFSVSIWGNSNKTLQILRAVK